MGHDRYDVIIVGAGPAGSSAALLCAENNLSVALIERGKFPGSKNMFGGTIYSKATAKIIPNFWEDAPLERAVTTEMLWLMEHSSAVQIGYTSTTFGKPPYNTFTVIRSRFDRWLADKAVEAGAHLMNSTLVEDLYFEKIGLTTNKVSGVVLEDGTTLYSDIVIIAEGSTADLTRKAGLRKKIKSDMLTLYTKEILALPREIIEARFNLEKNEGINIGMIGYPTAGAVGKGGIWVNKDTISIIVGGYLDQLNKKGLNSYQLLTRLKEHPKVKRLLDGAKTVQYMSQIIPKGGYKSIPELHSDGVLVAGNAGMLIAGRHGTDIAMLSGKYAAETAVQAKASGKFDKKALAAYDKKLENTFFMKNMKIARKSGGYYKEHPDSDFLISQVANEVAYEFFTESLKSQPEKLKKMAEELQYMQSLPKTIVDFYQAIWNWRVF
ncbi:MAG: FAD-dependent oxidoreductase [Halanaerobiales bacterium]